MPKRKVTVDYQHTFILQTDLERLGDGVIEVSDGELADWETVMTAYQQIQNTIGERLDAVLLPELLRRERERGMQFIRDGLLENWVKTHPEVSVNRQKDGT